MNTRPSGFDSFSMFAILLSGNITIWNGTIIEKRQRKYMPAVNFVCTRVMYHAHIEVQRTMTATASTVTKRDTNAAWMRPVFWIPET